MSFHDSKEAFYHGYVLSIFNSFINKNIYTVTSNKESGYGRSDIIVKKKDRSIGLVIELINKKS